MAIAVLALFAAMMLVMGALRAVIQRRRTGEIGTRRTLRPDGSLQWWALAGTDLGWLTVGVGAPIADLAGMSPLTILDHPLVSGVGVAFAVLGMLLAFGAQMAMGASWRTGIDEAERTSLVTTGAFRVVRNPIFAAATVAFVGLALMVPNAVAVAGLVVSVIGIEVQVRLAEEPYLRRAHGVAYTEYTSRVGRFLPGIGRLQPEHQHRT
ncbi:isoprenylcysteine carboxylmethyltransferase family protein [Mycobacterium sp. 29Ha]|uniref:methyltransferase family protein n=1 Tax=Mycobacterium sp. 29Ha TaxID=2939268 RepID=UPI002938F8B9|nr:isoprenylcysteine carboxylmethyltransferase family protein [Mycobacterium sp. 29Ha]MDV3131336.1 isoprenylcysteine carboxylmethyltransferase family protein [Mycobacterium sp. 29Ha]